MDQQVFEQMLADAGVTVIYSEKLDRASGKGVTMNGKRIAAITTLNAYPGAASRLAPLAWTGPGLRTVARSAGGTQALQLPPGRRLPSRRLEAGQQHPEAIGLG